MIVFAFLLIFLGFFVLSLSMSHHHQQLGQVKPSKQQVIVFRLLAWLMLMLAAVICSASQGLAIGLVYWVGLLTVAALLNALLLSYRPQWFVSLRSVVPF